MVRSVSERATRGPKLSCIGFLNCWFLRPPLGGMWIAFGIVHIHDERETVASEKAEQTSRFKFLRLDQRLVKLTDPFHSYGICRSETTNRVSKHSHLSLLPSSRIGAYPTNIQCSLCVAFFFYHACPYYFSLCFSLFPSFSTLGLKTSLVNRETGSLRVRLPDCIAATPLGDNDRDKTGMSPFFPGKARLWLNQALDLLRCYPLENIEIHS